MKLIKNKTIYSLSKYIFIHNDVIRFNFALDTAFSLNLSLKLDFHFLEDKPAFYPEHNPLIYFPSLNSFLKFLSKSQQSSPNSKPSL